MPNCSLMFNVTFEGKSDGLRKSQREAMSSRGPDVLLDLMYEVTHRACCLTSCVRCGAAPPAV